MKFPKSLYLELLQAEIEETMSHELYPSDLSEDKAISAILFRIKYAEESVRNKVALIILHSEGIELV